jgi:GNAT superfamily N-acetyltransferase
MKYPRFAEEALMARRMARLTVDTLADLPQGARSCVAWEVDPVRRSRLSSAGAVAEKQSWVSGTLLDWGSCGRVLYVDDVPAGFVLYAPPAYFPGSASFPTAPLSEDAVQLATAAVFEPYTGAGLGRVLMQVMVKDLIKRGDVRAIECIGVRGLARGDCALPGEFLQRVGFRTHRPHQRYPRMRLELRSVLTWREEMETALGRLLGAVRGPRPAPVAHRGAHPRLRRGGTVSRSGASAP